MVKLASPLRDELLWCIRSARAPRLRTMRQFAEQEIVIPNGPFKGRKFRCERQPFAGQWFDLIDQRLWNRYFAAGCTQAGKTLCAFVIPTLYHLFEMGETVIVGVPDMDMAADKWREDLLPVIEQTRYRELLPRTGGGSRGGGKFDSIQFTNGVTLKIMSGGGGDKSRAAFTARVLVVTEVDGFDFAGEASREADKFTQLEARTLAFGEHKAIYGECTVSIENGRIWTEYLAGTQSDPHLPCPYCHQHVKLEREHLVGWQNATTEQEARQQAQWSCPKCGECWSEADRRLANTLAVVLHRGQRIEAGQILGEAPPTRTLSFRWHAAHNFFYDAGHVGVEEWHASRAVDEENAEKKQRQFLFTLPHIPSATEATPLSAHGIQMRTSRWPRGLVPADTDYLTIGVDLGKRLLHYVVLAFRANGQIVMVDYGRLDVASDQLGEDKALLLALRDFRDFAQTGWTQEANGTGENVRLADEIWIDASNWGHVVYQFCRESHDNFRPIMGNAEGRQRNPYTRPKAKSKTIRYIGEEYHFVWDSAQRLDVVEINVDHWKSQLHDRLSQPVVEPGALLLFSALPREHLSLAKHLTAEAKVQEFEPGKGLVTKFIRKHRNNHWLDCAGYALPAGHFCGFRLIEPTPPPPPAPAEPAPTTIHMPDGRPYLVTER